MPAKVASQQTSATAQTRTVQSRTSNNSSRNDDSGSGGTRAKMSSRPPAGGYMAPRLTGLDTAAEGPTRRRQKTASNGGLAETQSNASSLSSKSSAGSRTSQVTRRRMSIRDQKAPSGPRPQENAVKRHTSGTGLHSVNSSLDSTNDSTRSVSSNSRLSLGTSSIGNSTKYENNQTPPDGSEFLAPISFDDFHNSIMGEPSLSNFPLPGHGSAGYDENTDTTLKSNSSGAGNGTAPTGKRARSDSVRRQSDAARLSGQTSTHNSMPPPPAPSGRSRRQSTAPAPPSNSAASRPPRKSAGPATLTQEGSGAATTRRRPSLSTRKSSNDGISSLRARQQNVEPTRSDDTKVTANARNVKAKSLQPPSKEPQENLLTPSEAASHSRSSSTNTARSPARSTIGRTTTPSSAKRITTMPPHVTGLGARTISPTDARRMKRMSQAPPAPNTPPTKLEPGPRPRSSAQSPSLIPRKSVTPSSSRTTPDPNRKSYSSGMSLSSNASSTSVRNSNGSLQPRLSQSFSTSRLPTPKPRIESIAAPGEDDVPPVPAIPKAFESSQSHGDLSSMTPRKSLEVGRLGATKRDSDSSVTPVANPGQGDSTRASSTRNAKTPDAKMRSSASIGKKNLQPLKLPPLNLLPLSTPMAAKIDALRDRDGRQADENSYTPPHHLTAKTPSTPMTASKASFFHSHSDQDPLPVARERSSTSHFALSSDSAGFRASGSSSALGSLDISTENRTVSPYISSSVPKNSGDFSYVRPKVSGDYSQSRSQAKIIGPRPQTQASAFSANAETLSQLSSLTDAENGSSLRNKLNLARRSSISKAQATSETEPDPAKYDNMPPPRLPASSTWGNLSTAQTSSPTSKPAYLKSRRKSSASSLTNTLTRDNSHGSEQSPARDPSPSTDSGEGDSSHNRSSSSILSPVHKLLSSAKSNPTLRQWPVDPTLDADDLAAEEEMRRLNSKRKDLEAAAKELEELRRKATPKERVSPAQALRMANLNIFERGEIIDFKDIYFCGTSKAKKHVGDLKAQSTNFGYDDERGDYNIVIGDHLAYRYEVLDVLGKGSFGQVVRCVDHKTGGLVAVKIIRNKKRFHQQALVEVNILQKLKEWDPHRRHNVVNFTQSFYFRGHLCISTELLGMNLYEFIKAHDFRGFSLKLIRRFTKQLLGTLILLHNKRVIHCDLKPENVLLAHPMRTEIKVIDFGSSCFEHEKVYTYIQSRFYRSPEVILGMSYGMPIDMWSLGCILAELYTGYPIFPGENEQEQLACIMEVFGPPEKHLIEKSTRRKLFFDSMGKPRVVVSSKGRRRKPSSKDLRQVLKCDDEAFLDFVARCLRWDPARRMTPHEGMNHEFITGVKPTARSKSQAYTNSPVKRLNTVTAPSSGRPLPEPPGTTLKGGAVARTKDAPSSSPVKPTVAKRQSTVNGAQSSVSTKRGSNGGSVSGTALPRVATRSISGKPDLATAAAATSLKTR